VNFDLNAILSAALSAAVQQATAPLLARIEALESQASATRDPRVDALYTLLSRLMRTDDEALEDAKEYRFELKPYFTEHIRQMAREEATAVVDAHHEQFNHEFPTESRIKEIVNDAFEVHEENCVHGPVTDIGAPLTEERVEKMIDEQLKAAFYLHNEQFDHDRLEEAAVDEDKVREWAREEATEVMDEHTREYDHDDIDSDGDSLREAVRDVLGDATFDVSVSF
jgi:hypothetical protein